MAEGRLRFRIGLFLLVALILFAAMVLMFGSLPGLFRATNTYTILFQDAPGIGIGAPVRRSGVRIGEVTDVVLDEDGEVRVRVGIDKRYIVRHNEDPTLIVGLLGPDTSIDFIPQKEEPGKPVNRTPIQPGETIRGVNVTTISTLINRANEVVPSTQETLNDIRKSMQALQRSVDRLTPVADDTLREYRDLARELRREIPGLRRTNEDFQKLVRAANDTMPSARQTIDDIGATARIYQRLGERANLWLETNQEELTKAVKNLNETLSRAANVLNEENQKNVQRTLRNLGNASENFEPLSRNANELTREGQRTLQRFNTTLNRLDDVLNNLQQTTKPFADRSSSISRNLDETLDRMNKTMADLRALTQAVGQSDGTVRRLLQDPTLYNRLDEIMCQVVKMMPRLDRILKDFETLADKLARHPESIGIGGVVHPGSGLKDPPPVNGHTPH
jgi:ABC-type transporter Mla subunit MlaD